MNSLWIRAAVAVALLFPGSAVPGQEIRGAESATTISSTPAPGEDPATELITNSIGMKLRLIPAGSFIMGSPDTELDRDREEHSLKRYSDEAPQHKVTITKPFYIGAYEVTQEEYAKVTGVNPSGFAGPRLPVEKVSWADAGALRQTRYQLEALGAMNIDAVNVGFHDLALGAKLLQDAQTSFSIPFVSCNVADKSGEPLFAPWKKVSVQLQQGREVRLESLE